jgi:glycerol-3-phosphate dehydrogenase (NAD(P)+)
MDMVAEGYHASRELAAIARKMAVSLPIINSVYRILHEHANPFHEFKLVEKQLC